MRGTRKALRNTRTWQTDRTQDSQGQGESHRAQALQELGGLVAGAPVARLDLHARPHDARLVAASTVKSFNEEPIVARHAHTAGTKLASAIRSAKTHSAGERPFTRQGRPGKGCSSAADNRLLRASPFPHSLIQCKPASKDVREVCHKARTLNRRQRRDPNVQKQVSGGLTKVAQALALIL